jgi:mRNA deadenylase 3'-5' endonuclease subunit Ccr4
MQAALLLDDIAEMYPKDPLPSLFICGDFNSRPPPVENGLYEFLHKGTLPKDNIVWTMNGARKDLADVSPAPTHKLATRATFASTYGMLGKEPPFTHSARGFSAVIDYIYCTPSTVKPLEVLNVFDAKEMPYGLPTLHYGADHICMCARYMFV